MSPVSRRTLSLLACCWAFGLGGVAHAEVKRVALVATDAVIERAVAETLTPWGITVVIIRPLGPGDSMPGSAENARALARNHSVGAVVWISHSTSGHALWVYDDDSGRVVARRLLSSPPFDEPAAAAVALSIKTLLRHSLVAPPTERYAGQVVQPSRQSPPRRLELEASAGTRLLDTGSWRAESQLGVTLVWWPSSLGGRIAANLGARSGVGLSVKEADFVGHYSNNLLELGIRARVDIAEGFALVPLVSGVLYVSSLDGLEPGSAESVRVTRFNPAVRAALQGEVPISQLRLGLRLGASYMTRRQRYLVRAETILEVPALSLEASMVFGLPL